MTNRQKRRDLRDALHTLALYKSFNLNGIIFKRVVNGIVITHPDSWLLVGSSFNYMADILYSPRQAIKILWILFNRPEYTRHDLFWDKMYNYQHKTERGTCKVCGRETNSISSTLDINYCAKCWNDKLSNNFMKKEWRDLPSPPEDSRERVPGK